MVKRPSLGAWVALAFAALIALAAAGWWYRTSRPEYRFTHGCEAAGAGDFALAERYAIELEESGQTDLGLLLRAHIEYHQGAAERALGYLRQIKSYGDLQTRCDVLAAQCLIALKNPREAEKALLMVLNQNPDHVDAHRWLAIIYYDQGDFRSAMPQLEQVAELDRADERPHFLIGLMNKDMDRQAEAAAAFQESLRRKPDGPRSKETRLELAEAQIKSMRPADALEALSGLNSDRAEALRAEALFAVGRIEESVQLLDAVLKQYPDHPGLLRLRGERYRDAGDNAAAAPLLERAVAADSNDFRARNQLALCYEALGRPAEAAEQHKKVKDTQAIMTKINQLSQDAMRDPWDAKVRERLAELCERINRPKLAAMWRSAAAACRTARPGPPGPAK